MATASASIITTTTSTGCHILKLSGCSHVKLLLSTGSCIKSPKFEAAGHSWRIIVYPNGETNGCAPNCISLYLMLAGEPKDAVHARFQFSFVRHGSLTEAPYGGEKSGAPVTFGRCSESDYFGLLNVGASGELTSPEFLKDDTILIRCDIAVLNMPVVQRLGDGNGGNVHAGGTEAQRQVKLDDKFTTGYTPISHGKVPVPLPSASAIAATARTGRHVLKVAGYSETKLLVENGKHIDSAMFEEAGHAWHIRYYPNGSHKETSGSISLFLVLAEESTNVHSRFWLSLVPHGELLVLPGPPHGGTTSCVHTFSGKGQGWGFKDFMAREELEKSEYLKDDTILVQCEIAVLNKPVVKRHDLETLGVLCECNDHLCEKLHADKAKAAAASSRPQSHHVPKKMLLGCFPIRSKSSQKPVFKLE